MIDVLVVVFRPDTTQLKALLESVLRASAEGVPLAMRVWHNDGDAPSAGAVKSSTKTRGGEPSATQPDGLPSVDVPLTSKAASPSSHDGSGLKRA